MRFIYKDNSKKNKPIIFQCEAELITEADKLYKESTGKDIVKQPFVGCQILPA